MIPQAQIELLVVAVFHAAETGTPVREMRILIDAGPAAAGPIARQLAADLADDDEPDELTGWLFLCLVLGELGNPIAAPVLADAVLRDREVSALAVVASEALGRIGASAMPEIRRVAASANQQHRLLAYFAAGRTRSADGNAFLLSALTADPTLADISALA